MMAIHWSAREDRILRQNEGSFATAIAPLVPGKSAIAVALRMKKLGIKCPSSRVMPRRVLKPTSQRRGWLNISDSYRRKLEARGITREAYEAGDSLVGTTGPPRAKPRRYTDEEIQFISSHYPMLSARQIGERIGRRKESVETILKKLGIRINTSFSRDPLQMGARVLVAKSCADCGYCKPASEFALENKGPRRDPCWSKRCVPCRAKKDNKQRRAKYTPETAARAKVWHDKVQALTEKRAINHGKPWSFDDDQAVKEADSPKLLVALKIGRTYNAVSDRSWYLGVRRNNDRINRRCEERWVVIFDRVGVTRALELEAAGKIDSNGIPTEADWDWND